MPAVVGQKTMSKTITGEWDSEVDVVVIGGGGAGMTAAVTAAETDESAEIAVLQKGSELGGITTIAMGSFAAATTWLQDEQNITDSVDAHFADIDQFIASYSAPQTRRVFLSYEGNLHEKDDRALRRTMVEAAPGVLAWLRDLGCQYAGPYAEHGHRVPRIYQIVPDTSAYADVLGEAMESHDVDLYYETPAFELITERGTVQGVRAQTTENEERTFRARRGVVMAAGSYVNNSEPRYQHRQRIDAQAISQTNTGDGHQIAAAVGAALENMDMEWLFLRFDAPLYTEPDFPSLIDEGAILVNGAGQRFVNELATYRQIFSSTYEQPNHQMYILFDDEIAQQFTEWPNYISTYGKDGKIWAYIDEYMETDVLASNPTLATVAETMDIDPEELTRTVTKYNDGVDVDGFTVDELGRHQYRAALDHPPYYLLGPVYPYAAITDGGIAIDTQMRALTPDGTPIKRLYAAGSVAGGLHRFGHGHHHAWTFTSGRIAGKSAVEADYTP